MHESYFNPTCTVELCWPPLLHLHAFTCTFPICSQYGQPTWPFIMRATSLHNKKTFPFCTQPWSLLSPLTWLSRTTPKRATCTSTLHSSTSRPLNRPWSPLAITFHRRGEKQHLAYKRTKKQAHRRRKKCAKALQRNPPKREPKPWSPNSFNSAPKILFAQTVSSKWKYFVMWLIYLFDSLSFFRIRFYLVLIFIFISNCYFLFTSNVILY